MEGQKPLEKVKHPVVFDVDINPVIDRVNIPWSVKVTPEQAVNTATVKFGDNGIQIILDFKTETYVVCDESGNQRTITSLAFQPGEEE